jgi:hypothetical protein
MPGIHPSSDERAAVRATLFRHLAGIVLAPTVKALADRGVFELFRNAPDWLELDRILAPTHGNRGYLRVALRLLCSYGWLRTKPGAGEPLYSLTEEGALVAPLAPRVYGEVVAFLNLAIFLDDFLFGDGPGSLVQALEALVPQALGRWPLPTDTSPAAPAVHEQIRSQLDGLLIGPAMVALARGGVFNELLDGPKAVNQLPGNTACLSLLFDLLTIPGWVSRERDSVRLTSSGCYAVQLATSYGVTVSYLPTFAGISTLLFGNARLPRISESGVELLVNRAMNVWGSGGAHKTYFQKIEETVIEIFTRPIEQQPLGICDMGCGDGTLLEHLYSVVRNQTPRGHVLDQHPLILVGADFNKVARRITTQTLRKAGIPTFHVIHGDINRPAQLAGSLEELECDIHDFLHVRSFLDHNRPYVPPANYVRGSRAARSTGAFAHLGEEIPADELEENLVRHLRRWAPYVGRFGLLLLELHTLPPEVTARNLNRTPAVAYDATHGFSDQYLVELTVFLDCAREAGLVAEPRFQARFPPSELATISVNFFTSPPR